MIKLKFRDDLFLAVGKGERQAASLTGDVKIICFRGPGEYSRYLFFERNEDTSRIEDKDLQTH